MTLIRFFDNPALGLFAFISIMILHEVGHAIQAKKDGIFKGFGMGKDGPHCKMTHPYDNRWKYLSGFFFSLLSFPLFAYTFGFELYWLFLGLAMAGSVIDLSVVFFYPKLIKRYPTISKQNPTLP